jgi:hypothetical protein
VQARARALHCCPRLPHLHECAQADDAVLDDAAGLDHAAVTDDGVMDLVVAVCVCVSVCVCARMSCVCRVVSGRER